MTLVKVTFEYSNGIKKHLDTIELEKWLAFNAIVAQSAENHNCNPPWEQVKWRTEDPKKIKHY